MKKKKPIIKPKTVSIRKYNQLIKAYGHLEQKTQETIDRGIKLSELASFVQQESDIRGEQLKKCEKVIEELRMTVDRQVVLVNMKLDKIADLQKRLRREEKLVDYLMEAKRNEK